MIPTILFVEDSKADELLTLDALRGLGVPSEVVVASDGAAALDYLFATGPFVGRDVSRLPRIVILELELPKVHGFEVLRLIREDARTTALPVVIVTSSTKDEDVVRACALGSNAYVRKPVDPAAYAEAIKALGIFWLSLNETIATASSR